MDLEKLHKKAAKRKNSFVEARIEKTLHDICRNPKVKATIVDLRGNGGGNAQYLSVLMSCFVDKPYMIGYVQRKIGLGRLDIGMKVPLRIVPDLGALHVDMPIVVISDINTGSEGELVTLAII